MKELGIKISKLRKSRGLTQSDLAQLLGLTKAVISAYENSQRYPSYDVLISLANIFHVTTDYLLGISSTRYLDTTGLSENDYMLIAMLIQSLKSKSI